MKITKFRDIPQFIGTHSCYHVNYAYRFYVLQIKDFEEDKHYNLQMNPAFQRGHIWTEEQQIAYIEYLLKGGKSGRAFYFNKPSWNNNSNIINGYDEFVCVDGLQRTTAIQRFINNELPIFGTLYKDYEDHMREMSQTIDVYINDLKSEKEVLEWYIQMNDGGTPHSKEEIERVKKMINKLEDK